MIKLSAVIISVSLHSLVFTAWFLIGKDTISDSKITLGGNNNQGASVDIVQISFYEEPVISAPSKPEQIIEPQQDAPELEVSNSGRFDFTKNTDEPEPEPEPEPEKDITEISQTKDKLEQSPKPAVTESTPEDKTDPQEQSDPAPQISMEVPRAATTIVQAAAGDGQIQNQGVNADGEADTTAWQQYKRKIFDAINAQQEYPKQAKLRRIEGTVVVSFRIDPAGEVSQFEIVEPAPAEILNRSASKLFNQLQLPSPPSGIGYKLPADLSIPLAYTMK